MNGSASHFLARPFVVMAARALGPGPTRLRLVKLAHNLNHDPSILQLKRRELGDEQAAAVLPSRRAA